MGPNTFSFTGATGLPTLQHFPTGNNSCQLWLKTVGHIITEGEDSVICSDHFKDDDYCIRNGVRELRNGAIPFHDRDEFRIISKVCRICLVRNVKMYSIKRYGLSNMYQELTGINLKKNLNYPQHLCWECAARLKSSIALKEKAMRTEEITKMLLDHGNKMTVQDIKCLNRQDCNLQTTLIQTFLDRDDVIVYKENDCINNSESEIKEEAASAYNTYNDECVINVEDENKSIDQDDIDDQDVEYIEFEIDSQDEHSDKTDNEQDLEESSNKQSYVSSDVSNANMSDSDSEVTGPIKGNEQDENLEKNEMEHKAVKRRNATRSVASKKSKTGSVPIVQLDEKLFTVTPVTFEEQIAEREDRKNYLKYTSAPYKCVICYSGFSTKQNYDVHMVRHSAFKGDFECFICKTRMRNRRAMTKHLTAQHTLRYNCNVCPFVTKSNVPPPKKVTKKEANQKKPAALKEKKPAANLKKSSTATAVYHEQYHKGVLHQCPHCPATFKIKSTYKNHIRIKHVSDFVCELCGYTFISAKGVAAHKMIKHKLSKAMIKLKILKGPYCNVCKTKFSTLQAYERHLKLSSKHATDSDQTPWKEKPLYQRRDRTKDIELPTNDEPLVCEQCGVELSSRREYSDHFRMKHPDKNRTRYFSPRGSCMCEVCGRIFRNSTLLQDHGAVHAAAAPLACDTCGKLSRTKYALAAHRRKHQMKKQSYVCSYCRKSFSDNGNRSRHIKMVHYGEKDYKCQLCDKQFANPSIMRSHIKHVHLKEPWPKKESRKPLNSDDE